MSTMKETILKKIENREITAAVIGIGYVGLPLAVEMAKAGFHTVGFDVQQDKVDKINAGENYIGDVDDAELTALVKSGILTATIDITKIADMDFIAICVPTPLDAHQQPDISFVRKTCEDIAAYLKRGVMVVLESTTYPGTTEELVKPILEKGSGLVCGTDFYLGFSPERVDPGNTVYTTKNTPKVVGAIGKDATGVIAAMYRAVLEGGIHTVSSPAVAEMEKILENTYRNVNIGLINELAILCNRMGIDIWEVIEAAKTKPFGFQAFYPGPGFGGHCIPQDPYYLTWKAKEYSFRSTMIEASMTINDQMPSYIVRRVSRVLGRRNKPLYGAKILMLGIAFKQDIDDYRESPALRVMDTLLREMVDVIYFDPWVPSFCRNGKTMKSEPQLTPELIESVDLVLITTAHTNVDYSMVQKHAKCIFDSRNAMKDVADRENIEVL